MESLAAEIDKKIQYLASSDCSGCAVMSLTQNDHDVCMMMSSAEKLELYFSKAVNLVAFISVYMTLSDFNNFHIVESYYKKELVCQILC